MTPVNSSDSRSDARAERTIRRNIEKESKSGRIDTTSQNGGNDHKPSSSSKDTHIKADIAVAQIQNTVASKRISLTEDSNNEEPGTSSVTQSTDVFDALRVKTTISPGEHSDFLHRICKAMEKEDEEIIALRSLVMRCPDQQKIIEVLQDSLESSILIAKVIHRARNSFI